ncbi:MAG: hypothetical protein J6Z40_04930 [Oscillospiraceae bacterium]|nr:hypothetical protein [Oscillospiraceae bacterium]
MPLPTPSAANGMVMRCICAD